MRAGVVKGERAVGVASSSAAKEATQEQQKHLQWTLHAPTAIGCTNRGFFLAPARFSLPPRHG